MQITVACHRCQQPKRPLTPCPACLAAPLPEPELAAWRISLHAVHIARITDRPQAAELPPEPTRAPAPMQVVVTLGQAKDTTGPASGARSFDWDDGDERSWLGRSA